MERPLFSRHVLLREAARDFRRSLPQLAVTDLLFKAAAFALFTPLLAGLLTLSLAAGGSRAVGNADIALFLLSPAGIAALIVAVPCALAILFLEIAGLMYIGLGAAADRFVDYSRALRFAMTSAARVLGIAFLWFFLVLLSLLPFLGAALLVYHLLLSGHDINYYLYARPPEFKKALGIAALLGAGAALAAGFVSMVTIFALPVALFEKAKPGAALRRSRDLVRGNVKLLVSTLVKWLLLWGATALAVNFALHIIGRLAVAAAGRKMPLLLIALGSITTVNLLAAVLLSFAVAAFGSLLVVRLYLALSEKKAADTITLPGDPLPDRPLWSFPRKAVLLAAGAAVALTAATSYALLEGVALEDRVDITAHRGSSLAAPENTLSAVERAIADGADYAEIDVQETADGIVVVAHDADLMRVAGLPLVITATDYKDLLEADVGGSFDSSFAGERIPTLEEILDLTQGRIGLNVELKSYAADGKRLAARVVSALAEHSRLEDAVIMSLKYDEVREVRRLNKGVKIGYTPAVALGDISRLDCDFLAVSASMAVDTLIGAAHAQGKEVHVWTVDRPVDISLMIDRGVDNIITNDPAAVHKVLEERAALSSAERLLLRFRNLYVN